MLALADHGIDEVVLSMGYLPDAFHEHFRDESGEDTFRGMRLRYAVEKEPLGYRGRDPLRGRRHRRALRRLQRRRAHELDLDRDGASSTTRAAPR